MVAQCQGDHATLFLEDQLLHTLKQFIDGVDIGVVQLKALDLGLGGI